MNKKLRKGLKIGALIFGLTLILLAIFANTIVSHMLKNAVDEAQQKATNEETTFTIKDIQMDIWGGNLTVSGIHIQSTPQYLDSIKALGFNTPALKSIRIEKISLDNMALTEFLMNRNLELDKIALKDIDVDLYFGDSIPEKPSTDYDSLLQQQLTVFSVDSFIISNTNVNVYSLENDSLLTTINGLAFKTGKINVDIEKNSHNLLTVMNTFKLSMEGGKFYQIGTYDLGFGHFAFDMSSTQFTLDSLSLQPTPLTFQRTGDNSFAELLVPHFTLKGVNKLKLVQQQVLEIDSITIDSPQFTYNLDANYSNPESNHAVYPVEAILNSMIRFHVKQINLTDGYIKLNYMYELQKAPLPIHFDDLNVAISNSGTEIKDQEYITFDYETSFMKTSPFKGKVLLSLKNARDFYAEGEFTKPIKLADFNKITVYDNQLKFTEDSYFDSGAFKFRGTNGFAEGFMDLNYERVSIVKLKETKNGHFKAKSNFFNLLANGIVKNNNIQGDVTYKSGYINYPLPEHKGFFGILWQSLASGIKDVLLRNATRHDEVLTIIRKKLATKPL